MNATSRFEIRCLAYRKDTGGEIRWGIMTWFAPGDFVCAIGQAEEPRLVLEHVGTVRLWSEQSGECAGGLNHSGMHVPSWPPKFVAEAS
jgi:hypothetical protein